MNKIITLLFLTILLQNCNQKHSDSDIPKENTVNKQEVSEKPEGLELVETQCYTCHSPSASESERAALPMISIKLAYLQASKSKEEFINSILDYAQNPQNDNAQLKDAFKKYGIMPKQDYNKNDLNKIASYLYDYKIQVPDWFEENYKKQNKKDFVQTGKDFIQSNKMRDEIALSYAMETKELLGKNLQQKLKQDGAIKALEFCNLEAIPLTSSISKKHNVGIKRVSDKPRNPINNANEEENKYISLFKNQIKNGETPKPQMVNNYMYVPIVTNSMCLKCHGNNSNGMTKEVDEKIKSLYPKDKAIGYDINQIRGMFVVEMSK